MSEFIRDGHEYYECGTGGNGTEERHSIHCKKCKENLANKVVHKIIG